MATEPEVLVCDIQRFSVHDGPGIRTTVFFKGCPLSCRWCHNPETIGYENEPIHTTSDCLGCGECVGACPESALAITPDGMAVDATRCRTCLRCTEVCPSEALRAAASSYDSEALLAAVQRDRHYYGADGGVTLSGGEPLIHAAFHRAFLPEAKKSGLHLAVETSGYWPYESVEPVLDLVDLFLFDLKVADETRHQRYTGKTNKLIVANLKRLAAAGRNVETRMPVIPGWNTDRDNLSETARLLAGCGLSTITLLPYHSLGQGKTSWRASPRRSHSLRPPGADELTHVAEFFEQRGIRVTPGQAVG